MKKTEILKVIYEQKDYSLAEKLCLVHHEEEYIILLARVLFYSYRFERAEILFKKLHMFTEFGYCRFFQDDKKSADIIWNAIEDNSPLIMWAKALSGYVEKRQIRIPTFFQIRNFYESDLEMLMTLKMMKYAENLINSIQFFSEINPEVYKFTARVLLNHKYYEIAEKFINAGKNCVYDDTELHFIEAQLRLAQNRKSDAIKSLSTLLEFSPSYYPAKKLMENIK